VGIKRFARLYSIKGILATYADVSLGFKFISRCSDAQQCTSRSFPAASTSRILPISQTQWQSRDLPHNQSTPQASRISPQRVRTGNIIAKGCSFRLLDYVFYGPRESICWLFCIGQFYPWPTFPTNAVR
jgi:hypothetical protein